MVLPQASTHPVPIPMKTITRYYTSKRVGLFVQHTTFHKESSNGTVATAVATITIKKQFDLNVAKENFDRAREQAA